MRKKVAIILLIVLILIVILMTKSFADNSFSTSLIPSSSRAAKGQELTVTIKVSRINVEGGVAEVSGVLKYNTDILSIENPDEDVKASGNWSVSFNEDSGKIAFSRSDTSTSDEELGKIKFKVSNSTSSTTTAIQLVSISGGNAELDEKVSASDITTNIVIGTSSGGGSLTNTNATLDPTQSTGNGVNQIRRPTPSESPQQSQQPDPTQSQQPMQTPIGRNTTKDEDMPQTGLEKSYIIPLMAFILTIGIISFVNYKRLNEK